MKTAAAITGVGYTPFSKESGVSVLSLARDACRAALEDARVPAAAIDTIGVVRLFSDSPGVWQSPFGGNVSRARSRMRPG